MCPPTFFDVRRQVNPWMQPDVTVDRTRALHQWQRLHDTYVALGHSVEVVEPGAGLDDMVFAANCGVAIDGRVLLSRMRDPHRDGESAIWAQWFRSRGMDVVQARHTFEGEGDVALVGDVIVVADGPRTDARAHDELAARFPDNEVVRVELVDPRFYHLDTALFALDDQRVAFHPPSFSPASTARLRTRFPGSIELTDADALAFGANSVSDGRNVVVPAAATGLMDRLRADGYHPIPMDLSELLLSGGSVKCCTLEVH